jgi:WD40 repeat protein
MRAGIRHAALGLALAAIASACDPSRPTAPSPKPTTASTQPEIKNPIPNTDLHDESLPPGAIVRLGKVQPEQMKWVESERMGVVTSVVFCPDGKILAVGIYDGTIQLWDVASWTELYKFKGHEDAVVSIAFSPDSKTIASGGFDQSILLWNVALKKEILKIRGHQDAVSSVIFTPDGMAVASGSWDKTVRLWDVISGKELNRFEGHNDKILSIALSPNGKILVSGGRDKKIRAWDITSNKVLFIIEVGNHEYRISKIVFSPNGKYIAWVICDEIHLWDVSTQKECLVIREEGRVFSVDFSPDGTRLASANGCLANGLRTINIWEASSGKKLFKFNGHQGTIYSIDISNDGKKLASGSVDNTVLVWDVTNLLKDQK